ncbi:MAG: NADP-dependent oxidoreductase [Alphaproteobacteria bacterium]|nr:NADP-dependent oxidoreductase [Alphaproteobacteria bacterium]
MTLPNRNRQIVLAARPEGMPKESDFAVKDSPIPEPGPGELLVRAHYLSADPFQRMRFEAQANYGKVLQLGEVIRGRMVGEVVRSNNPGYKVGEFVEGMLNWQEYAISDGSTARAEYAPGIAKVDPAIAPIQYSLGVLGFPGVTAYFALFDCCEPKPGETVVVSSAAGAVGSLAGQLAKIQGCRVVGLASTKEKTDWITRDLGFDAAINYTKYDSSEALLGAIRAACPERINVFFDNTGGWIADGILPHLAKNARVVVVGNIVQNNRAVKEKRLDPNSYIMVNRATMRGFIVYDYEHRADEARHAIARWIKSGHIKVRETVAHGIENTPKAFISMLNGGNIGKQLIKLV